MPNLEDDLTPPRADQYPHQPPKKRVAEPFQTNFCLDELRKLVANTADLPGSTPVFYQRIEDRYFNRPNGWSVTLLPWECHPWSEKAEKAYRESGMEIRVVTRADGTKYILELDEYIAVQGTSIVTDENGNKTVCFNAHY